MRATMLETAAAVRAGEVTPGELVTEALTAMSRLHPEVNAFTAVRAEAALAEAASLRQEDAGAPLFGVPVVVKDLYDVAGLRTTGCCAAYLDRAPAAADAAAVERLRAAGAVIIAKTNQHELACGATSQVSAFGPVRNPWNPGHIPGGSSGGSGAAVAAGVATMGLGSDTGGSIRIPAAMCGVTGLKPTHGAVSLRGAMAMIPVFDCGGPLAVSASDCGAVFTVLAGHDDAYLYSRAGHQLPVRNELSGLRVGIVRHFDRLLDAEVRAALGATAAVLEGLGAHLMEVDGPDPDVAELVWPTRWAEVANVFRDLWGDQRVSPRLREMLELGQQTLGADVATAQEVITRVRRDFERALSEVDVLLTATVPYPAPGADVSAVQIEAGNTLDVGAGAVRLTTPVNQAGLPALSLPVGFSSEGLPIGAQLVGPEWSELMLCSIGAAYQLETDWHLRVAPSGT